MRREKLVFQMMTMMTLMTKTTLMIRPKMEDTLNQEHTLTAVLGLTYMVNAMATQEEQILAEEDNDGAMNVQVNETEGVDNIEELQQQLLNQVADVDHQIQMLTPPPIVPSNITQPPILTPPPIVPRNINLRASEWRVEITVKI
jgi:hypothetical protein